MQAEVQALKMEVARRERIEQMAAQMTAPAQEQRQNMLQQILKEVQTVKTPEPMRVDQPQSEARDNIELLRMIRKAMEHSSLRQK